MYALRRQEGLEDRPPRAQRPPLGSPVSWLFVLPRFARRPARFMRRLMRGDVAIPHHTGLLATAAFLAATGAYGALVGGHMPVVMEAMTSASGLAINEVRIGGNRETSELDVIDVMGLNGMTSLATFDAAGARAQIAGLPWVAEATVRKNYPDTVQVDIRERNGYAVWQHGEHLTVIDSAGLPIDDYAPARDSTLPLVTGRGHLLKAQDGYHSHNAHTLALQLDDEYIVDGELYRSVDPGEPLRITATRPVSFLVL